jgi:hypothetical protein
VSARTVLPIPLPGAPGGAAPDAVQAFARAVRAAWPPPASAACLPEGQPSPTAGLLVPRPDDAESAALE